MIMEKEKLPKSFVRQAYVDMEIQRLEEQIAGINRAVNVFAEEDLPHGIDFIQQHCKTREDFRAWLGEREREYTSSLFLPKAERRRIHDSFLALADRVEDARNTLGSFCTGSAKFDIVQGLDGRIDYDWDKVREVLAKRNTYVFTPDDREYFQVLSDARDALLRIQQWEEAHVYNPIGRVLGNVGHLLTTEFSADWFQQNIGVRIGRSSAEALKMIREMEED